MIQVYSDLMDQGLDEKSIALGLLDEATPQLTANTVRYGISDEGESVKDTTKRKANTIGFFAIAGHSVNDCLDCSTSAAIGGFLPKIRAANPEYGKEVITNAWNDSAQRKSFAQHWIEKFAGSILTDKTLCA